MGMEENIRALQQEIRWLKREIAARPVKKKGGGGAVQLRTVSIVGGQTLATGEAGIKYSSSAITSVPSAYDATVDSSFVDGIGRGLLFTNGVSSVNVLILNDSTTAIQRALRSGDVIAVQTPVTLPVAGDPNGATVSLYPVLFL